MTRLSEPDRRAPLSPTLVEVLGFGLLALAVMWWRWGGTIEDSLAYFDTVRYLRGELPLSALRAPFPYRIGVPALVALLPFDARSTFATINWLFVSGSALLLAWSVSTVFAQRKAGILAGLLVVLSFSTFWFAPYLLVDPGSFFARSLFVSGVLLARASLAQAAAIAATVIREENILLIGWLLVTRRVSPLRGALMLAAAGAWMVFVRWYLIPGLPSYTWTPSFAQLLNAFHDTKSLASIVATMGLVVPLAAIAWKSAPPSIAALKSLVLLLALPSLYAMLCVRIDGRAVWGLYPALIPIACVALMRWSSHLSQRRRISYDDRIGASGPA